MARARLTIDLDAVAANWRALDRLSGPLAETAAVVKADGYGLGAVPVARALLAAGCRTFFVAIAEEGVALRRALGAGPDILVLSGYMAGDRAAVAEAGLIPCLTGPADLDRFRAEAPGAACAVQLDTGLNRLGFEPVELAARLWEVIALRPRLVFSQLALADRAGHPMNAAQLAAFQTLTLALPGIRRSLSATAGIMLGPLFAFEMTRPGIGLYGGAPFADARPALTLSLPVLQVRDVLAGEAVGYGATWTAPAPRRIATVSTGYADGLLRSLSGSGLGLLAGEASCPLVGRVSMDLATVDVTGLAEVPATLGLFGPGQGIDAVAEAAGTIAHELLSRLGSRLARDYKGGAAG
jgi:alanine racemase